MPRFMAHLLATTGMFIIGATGYGQEVAAESVDTIRAGGIEFSFASAEHGRQLLGRRDAYIDRMSPFDRQVRMQTTSDRGTDAFLEFTSAAVLDWPDQERMAVRRAIEMLDRPLRELRLPEMEPVVLIHTSGREEAGAAYTRDRAIILPPGYAGSVDKPVSKLIAHELFHVISRGNATLRDQLYAIIGFRHVGPISIPADLANRRITNPDAPVVEHVMDVRIDDNAVVTVAPLLYSKTDFEPSKQRSLFGYLTFRLLGVHQQDGTQWVPSMADGKPILLEPSLPDFHRQIGANTGYIIHPEEILAENFAMLVMGAKVKDKWIIDAIRKTLDSAHPVGQSANP